jgi:hypothetical protein
LFKDVDGSIWPLKGSFFYCPKTVEGEDGEITTGEENVVRREGSSKK